jgi:uncharacterized metal-binding protein
LGSVTTYSAQQVRPNAALKGPHSQPPQVVLGHDFLVFTEWATWSPCSKCGEVGKRVRFGICKVKLLQDGVLKTNTINISENVKSSNESSEISANQAARRTVQTVGRETVKIMTLFKKGIPCRSPLLPPELQSIPKIYKRKSEVMEAFCKVCVSVIVL